MTGSDDGQHHTAPIGAAVDAARAALTAVEPQSPIEALPLLRVAQSFVTRAIDEAMAAVVLDQGGSIRTAGALAGLSENAVGPRLARTALLSAYGSETRRRGRTGALRPRARTPPRPRRDDDAATAALPGSPPHLKTRPPADSQHPTPRSTPKEKP